MPEQEIAKEIADRVIADTQFWIAIIGIVGVIIGSIITILGNFAIEKFKAKKQKNIDDNRQNLLRSMLNDEKYPKKWRYLSTLSAVIGCNEETTKNHLIAIGARGSEKDDGRWGLTSIHPLSSIESE